MNTNSNFHSESTMVDIPPVIEFPHLFDPASGRSLSECQVAPAPALRPPTGAAAPMLVKLNEPVRPEDVEADPVWKLRGILDRVNEIGHLRPNWDSYGSQPPTSEARSKAEDLIWDVIRQSFGTAELSAVPFSLVPLSGGGVQIEWRKRANNIEVEVGPDGSFGYLRVSGQGGNRQFEERDNVSKDAVMHQIIAAVS